MKARRLSVRVATALLLAGVACNAAASWTWRLDADAAGLDAAQTAAAAQVLDAAMAALPPAWRAADGLDVRVQWRDDLRADVHGHSRGDRVLLRRALLDDWIGAGADAPDAHPARRAALAAALHEFAHRYDRAPHGGLSRDPRLRDLAGWPVRPLRFGLRERDNAMSDRSPDAYELTSPAEFVAVNLEHFLLDPEYACRRPALHGYFSAHFGWMPATAACDPALPFVEAEQAGDTDADSPLLDLDPARVHAVEYLLAEGNARPMSRWGHSMLRLVICAPGRAPGPDCRFDLAHHRVLSFRAFVDDVQISSLRGLIGRYPSRLFVLPLDQVVEEYTRLELRGLQSIPLQLSPDEIADLLTRAATLHWSYDGRYYFIGNNCAVETWKLLQTGVPRLGAAPLRSITPTGLLRRLVRHDMADAAVLDDPATALRDGYYFAPANREYQALYDVARASLDLPDVRVEHWLDRAPDTRTPWLADGDQRASAALLLLEQAALRREELRLRDVLKRRYLRGDVALVGDAGSPVETLRAMRVAGDALSRPALLLHDTAGYGLPQAGEREVIRIDSHDRAQRMRGLARQLQGEARAALSPAQRHVLETGEANIALLGDRLRTLHRAQGGFVLPAPPDTQ